MESMVTGSRSPSLPVRWACSLGAKVRLAFAQLGSLSWLLAQGAKGLLRLRPEQVRVVREVTRMQIRFTALDALPLCLLTAILLGGVTLLQVFGQLSAFGVERDLSQIMAQLVIRELGPLMVGILVLTRSGTAIAAEMASRKLSGELDALYVCGVDPIRYLLLPRLLGGVISVFSLVILFDTVALLGGFLVAWLRMPLSLTFYLDALGEAIGRRDLIATFTKCLVFGTAIPLICTSYGLRVKRSTTEIPQAVTKASVMSLLVLLLSGALLSVLIYA
ncbi:MAG: ABC transporter permease [Holophaga sp.]|jgi:phospholipid/cholesterol/gamma-HCH transport system permease protein